MQRCGILPRGRIVTGRNYPSHAVDRLCVEYVSLTAPHLPPETRVVYNTPAVSPPEEPVEICRGCGGKNPAGSGECDWCGRPFVTTGGRLRLTIWQVLSSLLLLGLIGAVAALAVLNAGRALPPVPGT